MSDAGATGFLLVPPLGADRRFWDESLPSLQSRFPCQAVDQAASSLESEVAALDRVRAAVGWDRVIPVGCAIGSMVAAAYAATHPDRAVALILTNATDRSNPDGARMLRRRAEDVRRGGMDVILPGAVDRAFLSQPRDERYRTYYGRFAAQDAALYAQAAEASAGMDASALLAKIICPTLVIAGAHDALLPPELSRRVHAAIPGAEFAMIEDAAHFVPYQAPQLFVEFVLNFLAAR